LVRHAIRRSRSGHAIFCGDDCVREEGVGECVKVFDKRYVVRVEDAAGGGVPQAVGFGERRVPDEDARGRSLRELGVRRRV
jgi:hypothetical protein